VTEPERTATCSARGCGAAARWTLAWNNPRLHTPDRRKTWLACEEHRSTLEEFLSARQFLRSTEPFERDVLGRGRDSGEKL
jgi:hypothetical protein